MLEIIPGRYFSQIWFLHAEGAPLDILGAMWKGPDGWEAKVRMRFYDGDQSKSPFEDGDTKRTYSLAARGTEEEALRNLSQCFRKMADDLELTLEAIPVRTDDPNKIMEIMSRQPWAYMRTVD
jgi:hypothetical protein